MRGSLLQITSALCKTSTKALCVCGVGVYNVSVGFDCGIVVILFCNFAAEDVRNLKVCRVSCKCCFVYYFKMGGLIIYIYIYLYKMFRFPFSTVHAVSQFSVLLWLVSE